MAITVTTNMGMATGPVTMDKRKLQKSIMSLLQGQKKFLAFLFDLSASLFSVWLALSFRYDCVRLPEGQEWVVYLLAPLLMLPVFITRGLYRVIYRYNGLVAFISILKAVVIYAVFLLVVLLFLNIPGIPRSIVFLQPIIILLITTASRGFIRYWFSFHYNISNNKNNSASPDRVLIYGACLSGVQLQTVISSNPNLDIAGFIDDDPSLYGRTINGYMVYSPEEVLPLIQRLNIKNILLASPKITRYRRLEIVEYFQNYPVNLRFLPNLQDLTEGKVTFTEIQKIDIEDLLGRDTTPLSDPLTINTITGKVIMVTGAGGSIGSELSLQLLALQPTTLLLVDNAEYSLFNLHNHLVEYNAKNNFSTLIVPLLSDVTNEAHISNIISIYKPSLIYHAAAYKHVPMVEYNIAEGVRNNVLGTLSLAKAVRQHNTPSLILVSSDKAVRPTNVMGASKRLCELILQAFSSESGNTTSFCMVRFGNVLGSSGSVVPLFRRQISLGGPITITHKEITRYFMTIPEAAQLVIHAGSMGKGGEVYLLDMGEPVKIIDLARRMVTLSGLSIRDHQTPDGDIEIKVTGLRAGEKLFEELLIGNNPIPTAHPRIYKANDDFIPWSILEPELNNLMHHIKTNNIKGIKQILKKLIPEYQPGLATTDNLQRQAESTTKKIPITPHQQN